MKTLKLYDILSVESVDDMSGGSMFIQLDGQDGKRIVVNTDYIECVRRNTVNEDFILLFYMTSGERIKLYYKNQNNRDSDFKTISDALCYRYETMDPRFILNYYKVVSRSETHAYVRGENYDAIEVTNAHDKDKKRLSLNISSKE